MVRPTGRTVGTRYGPDPSKQPTDEELRAKGSHIPYRYGEPQDFGDYSNKGLSVAVGSEVHITTEGRPHGNREQAWMETRSVTLLLSHYEMERLIKLYQKARREQRKRKERP